MRTLAPSTAARSVSDSTTPSYVSVPPSVIVAASSSWVMMPPDSWSPASI
jgi:hypothetical protein